MTVVAVTGGICGTNMGAVTPAPAAVIGSLSVTALIGVETGGANVGRGTPRICDALSCLGPGGIGTSSVAELTRPTGGAERGEGRPLSEAV